MIRDRLVVGIQDASLSQQLQLDAELTAKTKVRQREAVAEQQKVLKGAHEHSTLEEVHTGKRIKFPRKSTGWKGTGSTSSSNEARKKCTRCGKESHPREKCPAKDAACHKCGKKGHYSSCCFSKKVAELNSENILNSAFLDTVHGL